MLLDIIETVAKEARDKAVYDTVITILRVMRKRGLEKTLEELREATSKNRHIWNDFEAELKFFFLIEELSIADTAKWMQEGAGENSANNKKEQDHE